MGNKRHKSIGAVSNVVGVTPFKVQGSKASGSKANFKTLNATADNLKLSKKSFQSGSVVNMNNQRTIGGNSSVGSIGAQDHKRNVSLSIKELREKQVQDVKKGYRSNLLFEHTITDIIKLLEHKLGNSAISKANQQTQMDYHNFRELDSDSDDERVSNGVSQLDLNSIVGVAAQVNTASVAEKTASETNNKNKGFGGGIDDEIVQKLLGSI